MVLLALCAQARVSYLEKRVAALRCVSQQLYMGMMHVLSAQAVGCASLASVDA